MQSDKGTAGKPQAGASSAAQGGIEPLAERAVYWLALASIYVAFGFLWYYAAKEKLFDQDGTMPAPLKEQFNGSFLDSFPGLNTSWLILGLAEAVAFLGFVASLVSREFMPQRHKPILLVSLAVSMLTFGGMLFANSMVGQFDTVFNLFTYLAGTVVIIGLVLLMPPYRSLRWLSGAAEN